MITNPKNFFQQTQNFIEEVALKIKAINGVIPTFLTKSDAEATYLEKTEASNKYLNILACHCIFTGRADLIPLNQSF